MRSRWDRAFHEFQRIGLARTVRNLRFLLCVWMVAFHGGQAWATEIFYLYESAEMRSKGSTFAAAPSDTDALFLNPAALVGLENRSIHFVNLTLDLSRDIYSAYVDSASALTSLSLDAFNALMGNNIFARGQLAGQLVIPNFGLGFMVDGQGALYSHNKAMPQITLGYMTTSVIQGAAVFADPRADPKVVAGFTFGIGN